jgi:hypothetical protein
MINNQLQDPKIRNSHQNDRRDTKSKDEGCNHPIQYQVEETGYVWQLCKNKSCQRKLFVREL